jgi:phenylacetate-CoA ligase
VRRAGPGDGMSVSTLGGGPPDIDARVQRAVRYCAEGSEHYRAGLAAAGAEVADIRTLADLEQLPVLLTKADEVALQAESIAKLGHPFGAHLCAPLDDVVAVASTSGTTGDPMYYAFTADDVRVTDALWAKAFTLAGIRPGDTVVHAFGLSMFLAGVPVVRAFEHMGVRCFPVGAEAGSEKLLRTIRQVKPRIITCTPSYGEYLTEKADLTDAGIEHVLCAGEPGAGLPEVRARLSEGFGGAHVTDLLGGVHGIVNASCTAYDGMHVLGGDHSVQQLMDPETGAPVPLVDGATGVRVKTTLDWQAQPQLRASVGDVYEVQLSPCACGRTEPRTKVIGRVDDLLIIKGVKLYPGAVQDLVHEFRPQLTGAFHIVLDRPGPKVEPPLRMRVEVEDGVGDEVVAALRDRMHGRYSVTPDIEAVAAGSLPRTSHKAKLVLVEQ